MSDSAIAANRRAWDALVPVHLASDFYDVEGFLAGRDPIPAFERAEVGEVAGLELLHLQCHFGLDTLAWARSGARVTGLDFSPAAVAQARRLADRAGIDARFVEADVHDAPAALGHARYDLVYVNVGALCWLPRIERWADVVAALVRPGGRLYVRDVHPMLMALEVRESGLAVAHPYFEDGAPVEETSASYADPSSAPRTTVTWNRGLGEIVQSLLDRGFSLELLREHRVADWQALPMAELGPDRLYRLPAELRDRVPLTFSLRATYRGDR